VKSNIKKHKLALDRETLVALELRPQSLAAIQAGAGPYPPTQGGYSCTLLCCPQTGVVC
jgi:hypothetical protein